MYSVQSQLTFGQDEIKSCVLLTTSYGYQARYLMSMTENDVALQLSMTFPIMAVTRFNHVEDIAFWLFKYKKLKK